MERGSRKRWPSSVYAEGSEPDYRFSMANERTFLAWIRTSLSLLAAGVAVDALDLSIGTASQHLIALVLTASGMVAAVVSWLRWMRAERAMRRSAPLPGFGLGAVLALSVLVVGLLLGGAMLWSLR